MNILGTRILSIFIKDKIWETTYYIYMIMKT